jgi:hypothetical protein
VKGQAQQALLIAGAAHPVRDVQVGLLQELSILDDAYAARLLDDEHAAAAVVRELNVIG